MRRYKLLLHGAHQVVLVTSSKDVMYLCGREVEDMEVLEGGISILINQQGIIEDIGHDNELKGVESECDTVLNAEGKVVMPGFVDAHTHPVWAGSRVHEFAMKLAGASYMDIYQSGGGIHYTVRHTRDASPKDLFSSFIERLENMLINGSTTVECKSGYGLNKETEVKMLNVITRASRETCLTLSSTYCGAHAIPEGVSGDEYVKEVVETHLPNISTCRDRGELQVDNVDVFCETGVFTLEHTSTIIMEAKKLMPNVNINFHADELSPLGGTELGGRLGVRALSHVECASAEGIKCAARSNTSLVLLPTTALQLRLQSPPTHIMRDEKAIMALGTDFNPNAYCFSMPLVMHLACVMFKLSMCEAVVGATLNAAYSLNLSHVLGSLTKGKYGDLIILNIPRWEHVIYELGESKSFITHVVKRGEIIVEDGAVSEKFWLK